MLSAGVIEPVQSEWASSVVFAPKKDGTLRLCIDNCILNSLTVRKSYPIPRMDECFDFLGEAATFSTVDCNSGYWEVEIPEEDRDKTELFSHHKLFRFTCMPFGLKNSPATFQRIVDIILSRVKLQFAMVYLDDEIIYSNTVVEHFDHVREVLSLLRTAGVTLRLMKCTFFDTGVSSWGHIIRPSQLLVNNRICDAIRTALTPKNQTDL